MADFSNIFKDYAKKEAEKNEGDEKMTNAEIRDELNILLLEWIRKTVKDPATTTDVVALPKVAGVLMESLMNPVGTESTHPQKILLKVDGQSVLQAMHDRLKEC